MNRVEKGVEVLVSGVLAKSFYFIKKDGTDAKGLSTYIFVKALKVVNDDALESEFDRAPVSTSRRATPITLLQENSACCGGEVSS